MRLWCYHYNFTTIYHITACLDIRPLLLDIFARKKKAVTVILCTFGEIFFPGSCATGANKHENLEI